MWGDAVSAQVVGYVLLAGVVALVLYRDWCQYRYEARRLRMRQEDVEQ